MTTTFRDGSQVEVGLFGYESVIGVSALTGTRLSLNHIAMQMAGCDFASSLEAGNAEFNRGDFFQGSGPAPRVDTTHAGDAIGRLPRQAPD